MKKIIPIIIILFTCPAIFSQSTSQFIDDEIKATNYSVPSAVAFDILGVSPTKVHRPGLTRDFKLDWVIKDGGLNPNIAIDAQPVWLLWNKKKNYQEFKNSSYFKKVLSTLNLSVGSVTNDSTKAIAYGIKLNLFTAKNPVFDDQLIDEITPRIPDYEEKIFEWMVIRKNTQDQKLIDSLDLLIAKEEEKFVKDSIAFSKKVKTALKNYKDNNWNAPMVDIGFGQAFNYVASPTDSLSLDHKGMALWLAAVTGIGQSIMINGMVKYSIFSDNNILEIGGNIRYGGQKANGFVELCYEKNSLSESYLLNIAYGIDYKTPRNLVVQASLKTSYDKSFTLIKLIPSIDFSYQL